MSTKNKYPKGSEWRIWDLHIHTPGTKKNDQFSGTTLEEKWEKYIEDINNSPIDIEVIGITDYFSVENYFTFLQKVKERTITKPFEMIIPNVELRITPVTGSNKAINIHCLFNPSIDTQINNRFLAKLKFNYGGSTYDATAESLIRLGRKLESNQTLDCHAAQKKGLEQYVIGHEMLMSIFKDDKDLRDNTIIVVANGNDGVGGARKHLDFFIGENKSLLDATLDAIYQFSDAIFSSSRSDRDYFTAHGPDNEAVLLKRVHALTDISHRNSHKI